MQIQRISPETKELIAQLNPIYNSCSEMTPSEQEFLVDIVRQYKPKKLLELGIASGSSSVLLLNAIKDMPESHLTSIDYSTLYYRDKSKNSGFIVDEYPELKQKWTLYTGGMASEFMDKVGVDIDFCFIDTMHALPGEVIDFLLVLPYLKPDAVVVFHDTNLHTWGNWPQCTSNNMLVSAISGEKIVPETFENVFFHNTLKKDFQMYFPNITGIILDGTQKDKIWDIFNILTQKWKYMLKSEDIASVKTSLEKHYSEFYVNLFEQILNYQIDIAKTDKSIKDIIQEYRTAIENKIETQSKSFQDIISASLISQQKDIEHILENQDKNFNMVIEQCHKNEDIIQEYCIAIENKIETQSKSFQDMFMEHKSGQENLIENLLNKQKNILIGIQDNQNILKTFLEYLFLKKIYYKYKIFRFFYYCYNRKKYKQKYSKIKIMYKKVRNELNKKLNG